MLSANKTKDEDSCLVFCFILVQKLGRRIRKGIKRLNGKEKQHAMLFLA